MMDWGQCIVCQKKTSEALKCPLKAEGSGDKSGAYVSFMANVNEFKRLKEMPVPLCLGEDVDVDELVKNQAKWHKSCHLKFSVGKLERAVKRKRDEQSDDSGPTKRCQYLHRQPFARDKYIFSEKDDGHLHEFQTYDANDNVKKMAKDLQDSALLTRIEGGDLTALVAKYHLSCLTGLRNRHRSLLRQSQSQGLDQNLADKVEARAFVELATHIENSVKSGTFCFKFSVLRQMYKNRLNDLGVNKEINKVRFKEQVLDYYF